MKWECDDCGQLFGKKDWREQVAHAVEEHGSLESVSFTARADYELEGGEAA